MALSYGLTNPAAFIGNVETYPDLFKFYTVVPTRSTESTAANQRRPVLYTSLNGGIGWKYESQSSDFYHINYGGNFYFDADSSCLTALAHKSPSSSYGAYKARCGINQAIGLSVQGWDTSSVVAYNTANQPNEYIVKCADSNRYFCIRDGGVSYVYNDNVWNTANWTTTSFGLSNVVLSDDGGFRSICTDPENKDYGLVFYTTGSSKYIRLYLCNFSNLTNLVDYTPIVFTSTSLKQTTWKYVSIGFLPGVGYLIFFTYSSNAAEVRILRTHDSVTKEKLPYNQYTYDGVSRAIGTSSMISGGCRGFYCPWTKEYYFVPNASKVFWTKDGINWNSTNATGANTGASCVKFITDGTNMVVATSGSAYYRSYDKGQTWASGTSLSPNGFNINKSNDTIVLPFKCTNNLGIDMSSAVLDEYYTSTGTIGTSINNFRLNDYISIDPSTSYVFFGRVINSSLVSTNVPIVRNSRISFYDSNKTFISQVESNSWVNKGSGNYTPCIATSPSNAAYVRLCCRIDDAKITMGKINACKWYFAKESDFKVMNNYGDIVMN